MINSPTIKDTYKDLSDKIGEHEARIILQERANISWATIISAPNTIIDDDVYAMIQDDLKKHEDGKPLSRIYGRREFWGLGFDVNEYTLDPRPDSETIIEFALKHFEGKEPPKTIIDLGTGSGCLLLALLSEFKDANGIGVDLSQGAIDTAQINAQKLGLDSRCAFIQGAWTESIQERFDLIISNPPYIVSKVIPNLEKSVKNHDPILALDGGEDGLQAYNDIFSDLKRIMNEDALALFEIGFDQAIQIERLSKKYGIRIGGVHPDLSGNPRVVDMYKN